MASLEPKKVVSLAGFAEPVLKKVASLHWLCVGCIVSHIGSVDFDKDSDGSSGLPCGGEYGIWATAAVVNVSRRTGDIINWYASSNLALNE